MNEQTDRERATELLWQRDEARAKVVKLTEKVTELERLLAYANDALRAEIERANRK